MKPFARLLLVLLSLIGFTSPSSGQQKPRFGAPKNYVLVLGDSLAFGYQRPKFLMTQDPANFTSGFADNFAARLSNISPGDDTVLVNLACPSESATSFLAGPCAFHAILGFNLHENYDGSQIVAAEAFLAAHRGKVGPILVSLGANDVFAVSNVCGGLSTPCFQQLFPSILANLSVQYSGILSRLRRAAPDAEIITLGLYNPFAVLDPSTSAIAQAVNAVISQAAADNRARFANPFPAFNSSIPQPQTLCVLTLVCNFGDIHPSDPGYQVIAGELWDASGYTRYER